MSINISNVTNAINAYRNAATSTTGSGEAARGNANDSFSNLMRKVVNEAVEVGKKGEQKSLEAIAGTAELNDVITAVSNAEVTLQTAVTLRDRAIQAYQEILRMPI